MHTANLTTAPPLGNKKYTMLHKATSSRDPGNTSRGPRDLWKALDRATSFPPQRSFPHKPRSSPPPPRPGPVPARPERIYESWPKPPKPIVVIFDQVPGRRGKLIAMDLLLAIGHAP